MTPPSRVTTSQTKRAGRRRRRRPVHGAQRGPGDAAGPDRGRRARTGFTLSDLARALGTSKSTTLSLARTLTAFGMLRDGRPGPRYTLGTALIRLGDIAREQLPLGDLSRPLLIELAELTKMTSRLAPSATTASRSSSSGSTGPAASGSTPRSASARCRMPPRPGKAILATMTEQQVRDLCAQTGLRPRTGAHHHRRGLPAGEPGAGAQQRLRDRRRGGRRGHLLPRRGLLRP